MLWLVAQAMLVGASPEPHVSPDRPDVANGVATVAPGAVQLEAGAEAELAVPTRGVRLGVPTALRVGLVDRADLWLFDSDVAFAAMGGEELGFGGKLRVHDVVPERFVPGLGIQPMVLPRFRSRSPSWVLTFIVSQPLGSRVALDINAGPRHDQELVARWDFAVQWAASLGVTLHERVLLFSELYGLAGLRADTIAAGDAGVIVTVNPHLAADVSARLTFDDRLRSYSFQAGFTVLFAKTLARARGPRSPSRSRRRSGA